MLLEINKEINKSINQKIFYVEGHIDIDEKYLINKIEEGINHTLNNNYKTNVRGFMTSWDYFIQDDKFNEIFLNIMNKIEHDSNVKEFFKQKWTLKECWGIKEIKGCFTTEHEHVPSLISGILYLNDVEQDLIFPEINVRLTPKKGKFVLFSSSLLHYAKRNLTDVAKYGISFNLYGESNFN
jgi:hypothetical protein